jgi:GLPGLI family protein
MKKIILLPIVMLFSLSVFSQINSGYIKMEVTDVSVNSPEMAQMAGMMKGTTQEIYFHDGKQRMDMNMMGGMVKISTFSNNDDGKMDMLYDMMGTKMHVETSVQESEGSMDDMDFKVEVIEGDKKNILGYNCKRVVVTMDTEMGDVKIKMYVTDEISVPSSFVQSVKSGIIPGTPLLIETEMGPMTMKFEAKSVGKEVDKSKFSIPTEGYKKMSMADFQKQMGGMQMGF